jgi:hypothetical protein
MDLSCLGSEAYRNRVPPSSPGSGRIYVVVDNESSVRRFYPRG